MPNLVRILTIPDVDRAKLERRTRDRGAPVVEWRRQYAEEGLAGLEDAPRPGGPKRC